MPNASAAVKLLTDAADCGLRITGLDGWTQTRLAEALQIRRETLNAIINQSPGAEPTPQRPRMVEACRKLITFAAALSAKEDAVLKLPIDLANLQSDDGQAYEHHRLRLHKLVEAAAVDGRYTDALCRVGEFASAALHAAGAYRLRMICNLVTAIQRLLDKPESRQVPTPVIAANLGRVYRADRAARSIRRQVPADAKRREQAQYVSGQVGYALVFTGLLLPDPRLVRRGGRRLFAAVERQPDSSYGHWSNLLRATDDLLAVDATLAREWVARAERLAKGSGGAFAKARDVLQAKGEIGRLTAYWATGRVAGSTSAVRGVARLGAVIVGLTLAFTASTSRGGDGRDFRGNSAQPTQPPPVQPTPPVPPRGRGGFLPQGLGATAAAADASSPFHHRRVTSLTEGARAIPLGSDVPRRASRSAFDNALRGALGPSFSDESVSLPDVVPSLPSPVVIAPAPRELVSVSAMSRLAAEPADRAASTLSIARNYIAAGKPDVAQEKLRQVVANFPDSASAAEARALLASSGK